MKNRKITKELVFRILALFLAGLMVLGVATYLIYALMGVM